MGAFLENVKLIIDDLKSSWYFRLWSFFWLFCAVTVFAALIILGRRTTFDTEYRDMHVWMENATSITFPDFHVRINRIDDPNGQVISKDYCTHRNMPVTTKDCVWRGQTLPSNKCFYVVGSSITVANNWNTLMQGDAFITCYVNTTGSEPDGNDLIVWEDELDPTFGDIDSHSIWIAPGKGSRVDLDMEVYDSHEGSFTFWHKKLIQHSSVITNSHYRVTTMIASFNVPHFYQQNSYNGWMGVADVGGFAFFTIILHTIVMMILGICLDNDSRFLKGDSGHRPI